jgi:hypothetical protein
VLTHHVVATVRVPLPSKPSSYRYLDVSREPADGNPAHSGDSVLRGATLVAPARPASAGHRHRDAREKKPSWSSGRSSPSRSAAAAPAAVAVRA